MYLGEKDHTFGNAVCRLLFILLFTTLAVQPAKADSGTIVIPSGTILPVRLNATISASACKPGQIVTGRIMQNVLLASGGRIREGSKIIGHIVEVTRQPPAQKLVSPFSLTNLSSRIRTSLSSQICEQSPVSWKYSMHRRLQPLLEKATSSTR